MKHIALFIHGGLAPKGTSDDIEFLSGLVRRLSENLDITVFRVPSRSDPLHAFTCGNATVVSVPAFHEDHLVRKITALVRTLVHYHYQEPFSLVHGFWAMPGGIAAVLAGWVCRIPAVVSVLGGEAACLPSINYGNMCKRTTRTATLWTCRRAHAVVFSTHYQMEALRKFNFRRTQGIHVLPFGAEDPMFTVSPDRPASPPLHILHIGNLNRVKDTTTLLQTFLQIRQQVDARLVIVGIDTLGGAVQHLADEMGLGPAVTFTGYAPPEEVRRHLAWAHLLLQSSLYEGEGVGFADAAAAGVPICGTRVGLLADLGEQFAALAQPGDPNALADAALRLLNNRERLASTTANARLWASQHRAGRMAEEYVKLYKSIVHWEN